MEIEITQQENQMTARLVGRLDTPASQEAAAKIQPLLDNADKTIVMDCTEMKQSIPSFRKWRITETSSL